MSSSPPHICTCSSKLSFSYYRRPCCSQFLEVEKCPHSVEAGYPPQQWRRGVEARVVDVEGAVAHDP